MTFDPIRQPVDYIVLAGQKSPGYADVQGAASQRTFAIRQPPFTTGARIVFKRRELAKFTVRFRLYTLEHLTAWDAWRPLIDELPGLRREAKALDIQHPILEDLDIKAVVVEEVSQAEQTDHGEWTVTVKFLESRGIPKVTLVPVEGAQATPADPEEEEIKRLAAQSEALAAEDARLRRAGAGP